MKKILILIINIILIISCNKKAPFKLQSNARIISLTPSITRILFNINAGNDIIGVSDFCTYNGRISKLVKIGKIQRVCGFNTLNFEKIVALNPTIVLGMDSISLESKQHLERLIGKNKIHWFIHPSNIEQIESQIISIAKIVGKEQTAKVIITDMRRKISKIRKITDKIPISKKKRVIIQIGSNPFVTVGVKTFLYNFVKLSGGINALQIQSNWPTPTLEDVIASKPDIIIKLDNSKDDNFTKLLAREGVKIIKPSNTNDFFQPGVESVNAVETLFNYLK